MTGGRSDDDQQPASRGKIWRNYAPQTAFNEVCKILDEIRSTDMTGCELVALLTMVRPVGARRQAEQRNPAPMLQLVRSDTRQLS